MATPLSRLARPRSDLADSMELVRLAERRWGHAPAAAPGFRLGRVAVEPLGAPIAPWITGAPLDHPHLVDIGTTLALWPDAWAGFQVFVTTFWPLTQQGVDAATRGCTSGHCVDGGKRIVQVTVYDVGGCCEGLLHEWAHLRLEAMGIDLETHDGRVLASEPGLQYVSPVRKDKLRPMSAVLHGLYAWVMMSNGDLVAAAHGRQDAVIDFLRTNVVKLEEGILTVEQHAAWTPDGQDFGDAVLAWARETVERMWAAIPDDPAAVRAKHRVWVEAQPVCISPLYGTA